MITWDAYKRPTGTLANLEPEDQEIDELYAVREHRLTFFYFPKLRKVGQVVLLFSSFLATRNIVEQTFLTPRLLSL